MAIGGRVAICVAVLLAVPAPAWAKGNESVSGAALTELLRSEKSVVLRDKRVSGRVEVNNSLRTRDVTFEDEVLIVLGGDMTLDFRDTEFQGLTQLYGGEAIGSCRGCSLTGVRLAFSGRVELEPRTGIVDLSDTVFSRPAQFAGLFGMLRCAACEFESPATFQNAHIGHLDLTDAVFDQPPDLSGINLTSARLPCVRSNPMYLTWNQLDAAWLPEQLAEVEAERRTYGQVKGSLLCWRDTLKELGFERDATAANREAVIIGRQHLDPWHSTGWVLAWIPELVDGWGTRPWQPFLVALVVVLLYGVFYLVRGSFAATEDNAKPRTPAAAFALFYSVETFVPFLNVTGVKDWGWSTTGSARWAEVSEGFVGAILTLLAAYSFAANVL